MGFELVDRYLLGDPLSKREVVASLLAERSNAPAAAPFYRALEAVGERAADEAFLALRLVAAGKVASDENVRRLRGLSAVARACAGGDDAGAARALRREAKTLADLPSPSVGSAALGDAARAAYRRELDGA